MVINNNMAENLRIPREDFPVLSIFLDRPARAPVLAFYQFARTVDDIADDPTKKPTQRADNLAIFRQVLLHRTADPLIDHLRAAVKDDEKLLRHAGDLLTAFENDQHQTRFQDSAELEQYYRYSANPVGRFLVDLYGEDRALYPYTDALCTGLGLITNLRDCGEDLRDLDRVYIPLVFFEQYHSDINDLLKHRQTPALKALCDAQLSWGEAKISEALTAAGEIKSKNLRRHFYLAAHCGRRLAQKMRTRDILAKKVNLGAMDMAICLARAWWRA